MYGVTLLNASLVLTAYVVYRIAASIVKNRQFKRFAKENGCEEPFDSTGPWPYTGKLMRMMNSKKTGEDVIEDIIAEDFDKNDKHTHKFTSFEGSTMISTIEPVNLQAMLATQFKDFEAGELRHKMFYPLLGHSIFSSDGAFWEHSRASFRPQFSRENINDLDATDKACSALITAVGPADSSGWTAETGLLRLLYNFTIDTATDFLFGESVESQTAAIRAAKGELSTNALSASDEFVKSMEVTNDTMAMRLRLGSMYWLGDGLAFRKALKQIWGFTDGFAKKALDAAAEGKEQKKGGLLSSLVTQTKDRNELSAQTLAIMFAGRDTTASLIGWCWVRLSLHPDIFHKLRNIVLNDFPEGEQPTFAQLKSCRYLQHFLQEVLRLHPTVPMNSRQAARDTTLPCGGGPDQKSPIAIRKGQIVIFSTAIMQRRKELYGDDALEFKPERWQQRIPAWYWIPFLGGPRICLGQQFALTEASYLLVRMLREYDAVEPADVMEMKRMRKGLGLVQWPADGVKVKFHKAGSS